MARIIQDSGYLDIRFHSGDDYSFRVEFPFDITDYTIEASIGDQNFTVTRMSAIKISLSLTDAQTRVIKDHSMWKLKMTLDGSTRTYIKGRVTVL